jgi:AcrR family transcriptional regulator
VGRKPNPDRKPELLEAVVGYVAEHGLGDLSLRPLAEALGVSTYTLVYHFGSKEQLVVEVLASVEARQKVLVERWSRASPTSTSPRSSGATGRGRAHRRTCRCSGSCSRRSRCRRPRAASPATSGRAS